MSIIVRGDYKIENKLVLVPYIKNKIEEKIKMLKQYLILKNAEEEKLRLIQSNVT